MNSKLIERRAAEVKTKLRSLDSEFEYWEKATRKKEMGRQQTQVRRIKTTLMASLDSLRQTLDKFKSDSTEWLSRGEAWENEILAVHSIWEFFRSKLALRQNSLFKEKLAECDDLAYECYAPALKCWRCEHKGPPLVFFSATWSPFAVSRDSNFQNEIRAPRGATSLFGEDRFQSVLSHLPIPLISVPWYQVSNPPGALIIAHEVGHVVESDFALAQDVQRALDNAELNHRDVWKRWGREIFADIYGCCALGPAFAGAMMDLLLKDPEVVRTEDRTFGIHPPHNLRVRILCETLNQTEHRSAAARLLEDWKALYGDMVTMTTYGEEIPEVVRGLLQGPYRGKCLWEVICFSAVTAETVPKIARAAANNVVTELQRHTDVRQLFAAAQYIRENLQPNEQTGYKNLTDQIVNRGNSPYYRNNDNLTARKSIADEKSRRVQWELLDRAAGAKLRDLFTLS